jgi:hypothetical protein
MRFISGVIIGVALTIGGAYVHDITATESKPFVNWDSVGTSTRAAALVVREKWDQLTAK